MKKIFLTLLVALLGYTLSYYTVGKAKGYSFFSFNLNIDIGQFLEKLQQNNNSGFDKNLTDGILFLNNKDYENAKYAFDDAVNADPYNPTALYYKGLAYYFSSDFITSVSALNDALSYNPDLADSAYFYRGIGNYFNGSYDYASEDLYNYLSNKPSDTTALLYLAKSYFENDKTQQAIDIISQMITISPLSTNALFDRGRYYIVIEDFKSAINDYRSYFELIKSDYIGYFNCGLAYEYQENIDSAKYFYQKSIKAEPNYARSLCGLGDIYRKTKNYPEALQYYNKATETDATYGWAYAGRGYLHMDQNNYNEAITDLTRALENLDNNNVRYNLAVCYDKLNMKTEALYAYDQFINKVTSEHEFYSMAVERVKQLNNQ